MADLDTERFIETLPRFRGGSRPMDKAIETIYALRDELVRLREENAKLRQLVNEYRDALVEETNGPD